MRMMEDRELVESLLTYRPTVTIRTLDFRKVPDIFMHRDVTRRNFDAPHPRTISTVGPRNLSLKPRNVKNRAKRLNKRIERLDRELLGKPVEAWDLEELARGRPRNAIGTFAGKPPPFVTREVHEAAMSRFVDMVKSDMSVQAIDALKVLNGLITSDEVDNRGRALVPPATKLSAAQFLIEHIVGKPVQRQQTDISVKLQGILGHVMINPDMHNSKSYQIAHYPGVTMPIAELSDEHDEFIVDAEQAIFVYT